MNIRPEIAGDKIKISKLYKLSFKQENEGLLVEKIPNSDRDINELALASEINNTIVGHIVFSYVDLVGEKLTRKVLCLAPLTVLLDYYNRRIGSKLVTKGLEVAETRGDVLITVMGYSKFYPR